MTVPPPADGGQLARQNRLVFEPRLWPTLVAVPALAILVGLGIWQLQRLTWKEALIETLEERTAAAPVPLPQILQDVDLETLEFRRVRVEGTWLPTVPLALLNRTFNSQVGVHQIAALQRTIGPPLLVDRGWVPAGTVATALSPDVVAVEGFVRRFREPGYFVPDNEPARDLWYAMNADEMAAAMGMAEVAPVYLSVAPADTEALPRANLPSVNLRNDHLQYAITWFGIAAGLVVVFVVFHTRRVDD